MTGAVHVVRYTPDLRGDVLDLQRYLWGPNDALNEAYFRWKYEHNPYVDEPEIFVAMEEDKAIGTRGVFGWPWQAGAAGVRFVLPAAGDTVVHPDRRRRGVLKAIQEALHVYIAARGWPCILNMSAGETMARASIATGWRYACMFCPMHRHGDPRDSGRPAFDPVDEALPRSVGRTFFWRRSHRVQLDRACRARDMAELLRCLKHDGRLRIARDETFLDWRYRNPISDYRFLYAGHPRLDGFLVARSPVKDPGKVDIVDWEARTSAIRATLLRVAIGLWGAHSMSIWTASLSDDDVTLLQRSGFASPSPATFAGGLLVKSLDGTRPPEELAIGGIPVFHAANWDIRQICSDGA